MTDECFSELVSEGIDALPERVRKLMENVAIVVDDEPLAEEIREGGTLFGLYEGVPRTERGAEYDALPDKITIFKNSILSVYSDESDIRECVANTVWHEVAHHFGFGEEWVHREEIRRGKTK